MKAAQRNADRSRAARYRKMKRSGKKLSKDQKRWLEEYEEKTARWRGSSGDEDDDEGDDTGEPAPLLDGSPAPTVHFAEAVEADPERWTAEPVLPPRPQEPEDGTKQPSPGDEVPPPPGAPPPHDPNAPRPIVEEAAAAPDPAAIELGAQGFAAIWTGLNQLGLMALMKMLPEGGELPLPDGVEAMLRDPANHAFVLKFIYANAYQCAVEHPWLCLLAPSPTVVTLGSGAMSASLVYLAFVHPWVTGKRPPAAAAKPKQAPTAAAEPRDRASSDRPRPSSTRPPPPEADVDEKDAPPANGAPMVVEVMPRDWLSRLGS